MRDHMAYKITSIIDEVEIIAYMKFDKRENDPDDSYADTSININRVTGRITERFARIYDGKVVEEQLTKGICVRIDNKKKKF